MGAKKEILVILVLALSLMAWLAGSANAAPMGTAFTYEGHFMDDNRPAEGLYDFLFTLYDDSDPNIGMKVGYTNEVSDIEVIDGFFTVELDFSDGNLKVFDGEARWLEIGVREGELNDPNEYMILSPRQEILPVPYALYAETTGSITEADPTVPSSIKDGIDWREVSNRPAGLDDGDDVGTGDITAVYTGTGLNGSGTSGDIILNVDVPLELSSSSNDPIIKGINTGIGYGVYGQSSSYYGVYGINDKTGNFGLLGSNAEGAYGQSDTSHGVYGNSNSSNGVFGKSISGNGVFGSSSSGIGGYFRSSAGYGLIVASGNVGIGTESPGFRLEVHSSGTGYVMGVTSSDGDDLFRVRQASGGHGGVYVCNERGEDTVVIGGGGNTYFNATGNVGIGRTNPSYKLDVYGTIRGNNVSPSDARLKKDIETIDNALERVTSLRGANFKWTDEEKGEGLQMGVIAQEVEVVFPEAVSIDNEGYKSVAYGRLVAPLIEAIKELKAENDSLKQEVEAVKELKAENEAFKERLEALEKTIQQQQSTFSKEVQQ